MSQTKNWEMIYGICNYFKILHRRDSGFSPLRSRHEASRVVCICEVMAPRIRHLPNTDYLVLGKSIRSVLWAVSLCASILGASDDALETFRQNLNSTARTRLWHCGTFQAQARLRGPTPHAQKPAYWLLVYPIHRQSLSVHVLVPELVRI